MRGKFDSCLSDYRIKRNTKQERSELITLLLISKSESKILHEQYHIPFKDDGISHTISNVGTYHLCESNYNKKCLRSLRESQIVK